MRKILTTLLAAATLAACHTPPPIPDVDLTDAPKEIICNTKAECDKLWRKTQVWIAQNAGYKIQVATDSIIETYNAQNYSATWAFRAWREPLNGEREEIRIAPSCGQVPICREPVISLLARFKRYLLN